MALKSIAYRYEEIADDLRRRVEAQEFADGVLPAEPDLQDYYQASRNTVRQAVKLLVDEGLLETKAGQGTFVRKRIVPFVTRLSRDPKIGFGTREEGAAYPAHAREADEGTPEVQVVACPPRIAQRLSVVAGESVVSRRQERCIDRAPWSVETTYYPMRWVQQGATRLLEPAGIPGGAVKHIAEAIGRKQVGYRDLITSRLPDARERFLFGLAHNHTVIEIYRTSFTDDGTPIRVTSTVFPADRNQVFYDVGNVPDYLEAPT